MYFIGTVFVAATRIVSHNSECGPPLQASKVAVNGHAGRGYRWCPFIVTVGNVTAATSRYKALVATSQFVVKDTMVCSGGLSSDPSLCLFGCTATVSASCSVSVCCARCIVHVVCYGLQLTIFVHI